MPFTNAAKNIMLNALSTNAAVISLHTGDPGATGANEVSGGSPAYGRVSASWGAAANGTLDTTADATFHVPAGTTVTHYGLWTESGTFLGGSTCTNATFPQQGQYVLQDADASIGDAS